MFHLQKIVIHIVILFDFHQCKNVMMYICYYSVTILSINTVKPGGFDLTEEMAAFVLLCCATLP